VLVRHFGCCAGGSGWRSTTGGCRMRRDGGSETTGGWPALVQWEPSRQGGSLVGASAGGATNPAPLHRRSHERRCGGIRERHPAQGTAGNAVVLLDVFFCSSGQAAWRWVGRIGGWRPAAVGVAGRPRPGEKRAAEREGPAVGRLGPLAGRRRGAERRIVGWPAARCGAAEQGPQGCA